MFSTTKATKILTKGVSKKKIITIHQHHLPRENEGKADREGLNQ